MLKYVCALLRVPVCVCVVYALSFLRHSHLFGKTGFLALHAAVSCPNIPWDLPISASPALGL